MTNNGVLFFFVVSVSSVFRSGVRGCIAAAACHHQKQASGGIFQYFCTRKDEENACAEKELKVKEIADRSTRFSLVNSADSPLKVVATIFFLCAVLYLCVCFF